MGVKPKPDFGGYATKAGLKCSDGRTITPEAFKHMDKVTVPLVWQHGHNSPDNVLGHVDLEARDDGVYCYGYFNDTKQGENAKKLVHHKDIRALSIFANGLVEKLIGGTKAVLHGMIREVSLVLSGANPGAMIDYIAIQHSDDPEDVTISTTEAIIHTGLELEHADRTYSETTETKRVVSVNGTVTRTENNTNTNTSVISRPDAEVMYSDVDVEHATVKEIYDSLNEDQKGVVNYLVATALKASTDKSAKQSATNKDDETTSTTDDTDKKEGTGEMRHNVFEKDSAKKDGDAKTLSHADVKGIVADAMRMGSLKEAVEAYALKHGIENIDVLFPDAKAVTATPEFDKRRTEWVAGVLNGTRHTPFSRIKSLTADITHEDARAKGYVKGNLKKEEFFSVAKRVTTPQTIYKKQKLDRDDILDITDFDVVAWLKSEMRLMLEEELARAVLIGDGREVDDEDKIQEDKIRPIVTDHELYVTQVNVNLLNASSDYYEVVEAILRARRHYKGTGMPTLYTTEVHLTEMLLTKDAFDRRRFRTVDELANELRVAGIVTVEPMEDDPDLIGILVNLADYTIGADRGGDINFFDDFDIDYNQYKYLYETRVSGALTKIKSAVVVRQTATDLTLVAPNSPTFVASTGVVTIPSQTGVVYKNADTNATLSSGAQAALDPGETLNVQAVPDTGYYFATNRDDQWSFKRPAA